MRFDIHLLLSGLIGIVLWLLHDVSAYVILALLLANLIDLDHLWKHNGDVNLILKNYRRCTSYPLHKLYILVPAIVFGMGGVTKWLAVGLFIHLLLDFIENDVIFRGRNFRWF